jgi:hypothetical protein
MRLTISSVGTVLHSEDNRFISPDEMMEIFSRSIAKMTPKKKAAVRVVLDQKLSS